MTFQDEFKFQKFLDMQLQNNDTEWTDQDLDDYPECQHPSIEDII